MNNPCFVSAIRTHPLTCFSKRQSAARSSATHSCARLVPNDVPSLVTLAADAYAAAGRPARARLTALIPGLNPALEETFPYSDRLLCDVALALARATANRRRVRLLFKSAGTAAAASQYYAKGSQEGPLGEDISLASFNKRDSSRDGTPLVSSGELGIFVNPKNSIGDPVILDVQHVVDTAPADASWILFNHDFTADRNALGLAEQTRRTAFVESFCEVFYFRSVFVFVRPQLIPLEKGVLLRAYPDPYTVYRLMQPSAEYKVVQTFNKLPRGHEVTDALDVVATRVLSVQERLQSFGNDDKSYLQLLLWLAVVSSAVFWFLRYLAS